jgi:general secretion pathway protein M
MKVELSAGQSRALAVVLLVVAVAGLVALVATPTYFAHRHYDKAIVDLQARTDRARKSALQQPEYARALEAVQARNGRRFYLKNTAVNLAGAELQDLVRGAVEGNGGRLASIQIGQARDEGSHKQIPVNVQLFANVQSLQRILHSIETQTPFLFIDGLTLQTQVFRGFRPNPGVEPEIRVQLEVSAFTPGAGG